MTKSDADALPGRSRSNSAGAALKARRRPDGINLYAPAPISGQFDDMVKVGREAARKFFENPLSVANCKHDAVFMEIVAEGDVLLDKFRIVSQAPTGFSESEEAALIRYANRTLERGSHARIVFIYVAHSRYDKRVLGFEVSREGWLFVFLACASVYLAVCAAIWCHDYYTESVGKINN